jgi:PAS domain S-box-containing protein
MVEHLNAHLEAQNNTLNKSAIVSLTDLQGKITSVNDNFCEATGYNRDELLGNSYKILDSGEHSGDVFSDLWETITKGNTWRKVLKNKKKNGSYLWVDTAISPIFDDEGKPKQFFSLQFDITERKNYLDQLTIKSKELEDSNKLKDKLLSVVSHDFRGPLNSLKGTLSLFTQGALSHEELNMLTKNLLDNLDNTYNLLENLLNWAKSQMQGIKVDAKKINIKAISEDCIDLLTPIADKKQVLIKDEIKTSVFAFADNEMVKLVIRNLISNAIKFSSTGNEVILEAIQDNDKVRISVADNGTGISSELQDKLFNLESFSTKGTSNESGIGLGLLLCKDFVDKNGGKIWFESELKKGSTFYFTLPVKEQIIP